MIQIFILSFLVTFFYTPFGIIFEKGKNIRSFSLQLIFGLILLSFLSLLINFFYSLNLHINSIILLSSFIIIWKYKKLYLTKKYIIFCLISASIIFLLITKSNVYRPDAGLYHLPYISTLINEKIILGLSNIHFRFGHVSIIQYVSAISYNFLFDHNGIVFPSSLVVTGVILNFLSNINNYIKKNKFDLHFFFIFSLLIFIFYKINRYSEYGNDAPSHLLLFLLVSEIIKNYKIIKNKKFSNLLLLSFFIVMNKIILLFSIFFLVIFYKKKNVWLKIVNRRNFFALTFMVMWIFKNVLVSGCLLFPVSFTCISNLAWTNEKLAKEVSIENEAWAKGWPDYRRTNVNLSQAIYLEDFNWLKTWSKNHFKKISKIILPYFIFLLIFLFIIKQRVSKFNIENYLKSLIGISILGTLVWLLKVPVFRYGYSYLILSTSLIFSLVGSNLILKNNKHLIFKATISIFLIIFTAKNLNRIIFDLEKYYNYPWPKFYSMSEGNNLKELKYKFVGEKKVYYSEDGHCMYGYSPCGIQFDKIKYKKLFSYSLFYNSSD